MTWRTKKDLPFLKADRVFYELQGEEGYYIDRRYTEEIPGGVPTTGTVQEFSKAQNEVLSEMLDNFRTAMKHTDEVFDYVRPATTDLHHILRLYIDYKSINRGVLVELLEWWKKTTIIGTIAK